MTTIYQNPNDFPISNQGIEPDFNLSDDQLLQLSNQWERESNSYHDELLKVQKTNEDYYLGKQTLFDRIPASKSNAVQNHIFMGTETLLPVMTSNPAQFVVVPAQDNEVSEELARAHQEVLSHQYEERNVREKLQEAARHMIVYRFGVIKMFWDEEIDDWNLKVIRPQRIWIPKFGTTVDELPFIREKMDMTIDEIETYFGKKMADRIRKVGVREQVQDNTRSGQSTKLSNVYTVWENWTNEFVFWKSGGTILGKMKNPYFDWRGRKKKFIDESGNAVVQDLFYNHFRKPRKPYIFLSPFRLGNSIVGETSLVEQAIPIQDVINTILRQIVNNAKKMGNAAWFIDADTMSEEEVRNRITNDEGLIVYGSGVANPNMIRRESPPPLPAYIQNTLIQAENAFDNIFGTHSTTRGERRQPETLGGRLILKQADISRIDLLVREIDRAVSEIGNWATQLMRLFWVSEKTVKIYGEKGIKFIEHSADNIEQGILVYVKAGSTLQLDEIGRRNEALQLFSIGALDPVTLYERLKFPNPEEAAERLNRWRMGQISPRTGETPVLGGRGEQRSVTPLVSPQVELGEAVRRIT